MKRRCSNVVVVLLMFVALVSYTYNTTQDNTKDLNVHLSVKPFSGISNIISTVDVDATVLANNITYSTSSYEADNTNINKDIMSYDDIIIERSVQEHHVPAPQLPEQEVKQRKYNFTDEDISVLSKIIQAEAGNQSLKGKCLVGRVVLNRVESGNNNTIKKIVFAYSNGTYQFTPISDKRYFSAIPTQSVYEAIDMLSYGWDESLGAQYFCRGYSGWHERNLIRLFKEGDHIFYR